MDSLNREIPAMAFKAEYWGTKLAIMEAMKLVIQMSPVEELKALPILLRHSPGMMLRNGTYVVTTDAARKLRHNGVVFAEPGGNPDYREGC